MLLMIQWLLSYLIMICGKVFTALLPDWSDKQKKDDNDDD